MKATCTTQNSTANGIARNHSHLVCNKDKRQLATSLLRKPSSATQQSFNLPLLLQTNLCPPISSIFVNQLTHLGRKLMFPFSLTRHAPRPIRLPKEVVKAHNEANDLAEWNIPCFRGWRAANVNFSSRNCPDPRTPAHSRARVHTYTGERITRSINSERGWVPVKLQADIRVRVCTRLYRHTRTVFNEIVCARALARAYTVF